MSTSKLVLEFYDSTGGTFKHSYPHVDEDVTTNKVKGLVQATITNGSIFDKVPVSTKSAKLVTTTESEFQLSS